MGIKAEVMDRALNVYLGSEAQWCTGAMARDRGGQYLEKAYDSEAVSHCAEGAIRAAVWDVARQNRAIDVGLLNAVRIGVERILVEQNPEIVEALLSSPSGDNSLVVRSGTSLPTFNDGFSFVEWGEDGVDVPKAVRRIPSIGYQGIRAAFEKYLSECEEKDL